MQKNHFRKCPAAPSQSVNFAWASFSAARLQELDIGQFIASNPYQQSCKAHRRDDHRGPGACPYDLRKLAHSSFSFSSEVVLSRAQANTVRHDHSRELREPNNGII